MLILRTGRVTAACLTLLFTVLSAGCGTVGETRDANTLFEHGQYAEAVRKYRDVSEADPRNAHYQQQYLLKRTEALQRLFTDAERARQAGNLSDAEHLYQVALEIDPGNAIASEWLRRIADMRRHTEQIAKADELIAAGDIDTAEPMVRTVLAEEPDNARARNSLDRIRMAKESKTQRESGELDDHFKKPVTLEFRDVPVKVAFEVLSKASGINFVYDQDIRPDLKVTVFLRKTPLDEAIRLIGLSTQLETRVLNANSVLVYPNTPQKVSDYRELSIRTFYLANADAKAVAETIKTILKTENLIVDEKLNMLVMRDSPEAIRLAEKLIALQDVGEPEVMLDVEVLEVKHSRLLDMGISLPQEVGLSVVSPTSTGSGALSLDSLRGLNSSSIYATVPNATVKLHDEGSVAKILANPKIRVKSKEKASVLIGDKVPVITSTSTSTGFVAETVSYVDVGLKLEVEPSVYQGDEVSIKMNLEVSNLVREIVSHSGTLSYQIGTRNAQTVLRLKDGETQILAGLINKEDRKVSNGWPGLSRFPILNRIFGSQKDDKQDTEIVLSITPHLIRGIPRVHLSDLEFDSGTATHLGGAAPASALAQDETDVSAVGAKDAGTAAPTDSTAPGAPGATVMPIDAPTPAPTAASPGTNVLLDWSAPAEVRVGEQFTAVLNVSALQPIDQLAVLVGFDPKALQVVNVEEGPFMAQGGAQSSLSKQVNPLDGRITATATRQGTSVSGQSALLQITFKALSVTDKTEIQLMSGTPGPEQAGAAKLSNVVIKIK